MFIEAGALAEALGAHVTLVWAMLLVHVQDVNAQPVALLKRPVNQILNINNYILTISITYSQLYNCTLVYIFL